MKYYFGYEGECLYFKRSTLKNLGIKDHNAWSLYRINYVKNICKHTHTVTQFRQSKYGKNVVLNLLVEFIGDHYFIQLFT